MTLYLSEKYFIRQDIRLLGYVGENNSREITVCDYEVEGADSYRLMIEYADGVAYELEILDGKVTLNASVLRIAGEVNLQLHALKKNGDTYEYVKKSNIFKADIKDSITDEVAPIPTPEVAQSILDEIKGTSGGESGTGSDGYTPQRGVDYWTDEDIVEIHSYIDNQIGTANTTLETILDGGAE